MEVNDEGKIQLEETLNESTVNGTDSTISDSDAINDSHNSETTFDESVPSDIVRGPTAEVLSVDEHDSGNIDGATDSSNYQNHVITNQINNINTKCNENDNGNESDANVSTIHTSAGDSSSSPTITTSTATIATPVVENGVALNNSNNDAANAVGFAQFATKTTNLSFTHSHTQTHKQQQLLIHSILYYTIGTEIVFKR